MPDQDKPSFDEVRDAMMPPGTDKTALLKALREAQLTGGHVPGRVAPDTSAEPSPGALAMLGKLFGSQHVPHGTLAGEGDAERYSPPGNAPEPSSPPPGRASASCLPGLPADPFTPGRMAGAALAEMFDDLVASRIPLASVESILGNMLAAYARDQPDP
jgi:hypothetical protein